ncbi:MAG TPA: site-specific integrase [Vicinamibacterales bacterium]|nr:site-specific integrase [Vicinamibacterales bacterium]
MSVRRRGRTWQYVIELGRDAAGRRLQVKRSGFRTRREAEEAEAEERVARAGQLPVPAAKLTLAQYLDRWLAGKDNLRESTAKRYAELIRVHVKPAIGDVPLRRLRALDVQACYGRVVKVGRSATTALQLHRVLKQALAQAVKWGYLARNPVDGVQAPSKAPSRTRTPTLEETLRILELADATPYGPIFRLAVLTGLRQGELLALRWQDVGTDTITATRTARRRKGEGIVMTAPKTRASARTIAIGPAAAGILAAHRRRQAEEKMRERLDYQDAGLVFADPLGRPIPGEYLTRTMQRLAAAAGCPGVRFHDLRHAHASFMLAVGAPMKAISERLGHSSITVTADIYAHVEPRMDRELVERLEAALAAAREKWEQMGSN